MLARLAEHGPESEMASAYEIPVEAVTRAVAWRSRRRFRQLEDTAGQAPRGRRPGGCHPVPASRRSRRCRTGGEQYRVQVVAWRVVVPDAVVRHASIVIPRADYRPNREDATAPSRRLEHALRAEKRDAGPLHREAGRDCRPRHGITESAPETLDREDRTVADVGVACTPPRCGRIG